MSSSRHRWYLFLSIQQHTYTKLISIIVSTFLHKTIGEKKDMQRIQCPICKQDGVLQWKKTVTKAKGRTYHYRKLYVYHHHPDEHPKRPKWCYLSAQNLKELGITQNRNSITQNLTQNNSNSENLNLRLVNQNQLENMRAGSLARLGHLLDVQKVAGSSPARPTTNSFYSLNLGCSLD